LANFQTNPTNIQDDLNNLRSQVSNLLDNQVGNWYDDLNTPAGGTQRGVNDLNTDLNDIENKKLICPVQVLTNVTVPGGQNYVVLSQASSETPTNTAAVTSTALGAIVAVLGGDVGAHATTLVAGTNALNPKNLVWIRNATTKDAITSGGQEVFGLLQAESGTTDGEAFNDTDTQVQISFVKNGGSDTLVAVPVADIENKVIEYMYPNRIKFDNIPEDCTFPLIKWADQVSAIADVTRQHAYDNQGTTAVNLLTNATLDLEGAGLIWAIRDDLEANLFRIIEGSAGGTSQVHLGSDVDVFNVDAIDNDFANAVKVATGGQQINIGVTAGTISSDTAEDLRILGTAELYLDDGNQTGSTWAQTSGIKLSDTTAEWDLFETNFGEVSLLSAINQAYASSNITKTYANVTSTTTADTNVGGVGGGANLDAQLPDLSLGSFLVDYDVYLNGDLLRPGANSGANNDYYPGTSLVNGQLKFEFTVKVNDVICVVARA
jgi:hypothetical protein